MSFSLNNLTNVVPKELFGKSPNQEVSIEITPTGIVLGADLTTTPFYGTISQAGISTTDPNGYNLLSTTNFNNQALTNIGTETFFAGIDISDVAGNNINTDITTGDMEINSTGEISLFPSSIVSINHPTLSQIEFKTGLGIDPVLIYQDDANDFFIKNNSSQMVIENTFGGVEIKSGDFINLTSDQSIKLSSNNIEITSPNDISINAKGSAGVYLNSEGLDVVCSAPNGGVALEASLVNILSATTSSVIAPGGFYVGLSAYGTGDGIINANLNGKVNLTSASSNLNYTILVADGNTGYQNIKGSGSDLNYNPFSQTLSVKNMIVSGNESQTGIITTNVLKTDIMYQQVSYTNTAIVSIPTTTALLAYGTFFMSTYDTGSTIVNSIVQYIFPTLPTDGSMDGYTFQIRKLRGGVNQSTQNWVFTAPGNFILPNGNTLNAGSGGAVNNTTPNSFTQRFTIATYNNVGYYVGCNN